MIIKNNSTKLLVSLLFLLILPFVQKQWFNLYLFNINDFSFYSILYYLSGTICPSFVCFNSLRNYTYYNFNNKKIYNNEIKGKGLLLLVVINLIFLSFFISDYIYINFDIICNLFLKGNNLPKPDIFQFSLFILLNSILLIFKKSRLLFKKLILVNYILISFYLWHLQINNINVDDQFHIYRYFRLNDLNLINVFILIAIEISYFTWSFLSYKTNLSDWIVRTPQNGDIIPLLNMVIFYFFIIIYYSILT
ncbi:conserved hypothetical protein [Prochlorococcus marinus str. MIT 9312]|uniref:Uncharacterized protein n=1 Tax=Prochlorococcus marinus (strain MIT 9312) TaxID=74546 RepID=Q31AU0_PROM9|nr:conserved hypothetical protein [Prochlorococcus marinus str. MIT 9312]KGF98992.1 hypothetical protein EU97_1550 [Prochlorococcus marinus str. MIT 9311]